MNYFLVGESLSIKTSGSSKGVSYIFCFFGSGKSFSQVVCESIFVEDQIIVILNFLFDNQIV